LKVNCKAIPHVSPAFPNEAIHWAPLLNVKLIQKHTSTKWIECYVDSGSPSCMFHANLCKPLGIRKVEKGIEDTLGGVIGGATAPMYYHNIGIQVGTERFQTMAAFSWEMSVVGILGRRGFFDSFSVKFDPSTSPPTLELDRI